MRLAVLSAGAPRHGRNITQQWQSISDGSGFGWELTFLEWVENRGYDDYDFKQFDWCVWVGVFERAFDFMLQLPGCKHAALWVGTDLLQHQGLVAQGYPDPFQAARIHLADAPNLQAEAHELTGLNVGYVRSIPPKTYSPTPITRWDNVLAYVPPSREDFFRWEWILELARDYPGITFNVVPRDKKTTDVPNVKEIADISGVARDELYETCFAHLRPIEHDGIGLTMVEFAQLGRFIFHSDTRIPFVNPARSVGEMEVYLDIILRCKQPPDPKIADYYIHEFNTDALENDLTRLKTSMET